MSKPVVLAAVSDTHCNSTVGLCPPQGCLLDDGGRYLPSKAQLWLWEKWLDYWGQVERAVVDRQAVLYCLFNGDAVDGPHHHGTTQSVTGNEEEQDYIATETYGVPRKLNPSRIFVTRGTEVHVGPSGSSEEKLAKWLRAERDLATEKWSSWHWRLEIHGVRIDAQHHTTMGRLPWTEANGANSLAARVFMAHAKAGLPHPHLVLRSHVHRTADSYKAQPSRAVILPAWQLKTGYAHKVAPDALSDVGGVITVIEPDGTFDLRTVIYKAAPPPVWKAA